jgi:hypothetical protein
MKIEYFQNADLLNTKAAAIYIYNSALSFKMTKNMLVIDLAKKSEIQSLYLRQTSMQNNIFSYPELLETAAEICCQIGEYL